MTIKNLIFTAFPILTFCAFALGQNSNCPTISVTGPSSTVQPGETMTFTASVTENGSDLSKLNFQWSVNKGTIVEGQGTLSIFVSTEGLMDTTITSTVEIKGLANDCVKLFAETGVVSGGGDPIIFDEFEKLPGKDEKARLSALVSELKNNKESKAFIILYHPSKNKKMYESRVLRLKNFLVKENKIPTERISIVLGGDESQERTRIYIVPKDVELQTP